MIEEPGDQRGKILRQDVKFFSVEYPGNVINENNAIRTLGGMEELCRIHEHEDKIMKLNFRPDHWSSHPLYGDRVPASNLLLKVKIPKNKENKAIQSEIVGMIPVTYQFRTLSDMQCLFPQPTEEEANEIVFGIPEAKAVEIIPRSFMKVDHPQPYNFERCPQFYYNETENKWLRKPSVLNPRRQKIPRTLGNAKETPKELESVPNLGVHSKALYDQLKKLFETRPLWTKEALKLNVPQALHSRFVDVLKYVAYFFRSGPYKFAWVRLGYDPRKDKESRVYQVLDYRIKVATRASVKYDVIEQAYQRKLKTTLPFIGGQHIRRREGPDYSDFSVQNSTTSEPAGSVDLKSKVSSNSFKEKPISRSTPFQLIDVQLDEVKKIIKQTTGVYHEKYGWFTQKNIKDIRNIMNKKFLSFFEEVREENKGEDGAEIDEIGAPTMRESEESEDAEDEDYEVEEEIDSKEEDEEEENEIGEEVIESSQTIGFLSQLMKSVVNGEDIQDDLLQVPIIADSFNTGDQEMDVEAFDIL